MRTLIAISILFCSANAVSSECGGGGGCIYQMYNYQPQVIQLDPVQQYLIRQKEQQRDLEMRQQQYFMQRNAADNYRREYVSPLRIYGY